MVLKVILELSLAWIPVDERRQHDDFTFYYRFLEGRIGRPQSKFKSIQDYN
jgi:elongation factor P hydroxylase